MKAFKNQLKVGLAVLLLASSSLALSQQQPTKTQKLNILSPTNTNNPSTPIPNLPQVSLRPQEQLPPGNIPAAPPVTVTLVPNQSQ